MAQMEVLDSSNLLVQAFDRGMQSRALSDQLATVVNTVSLVKKNPFPQFVNSLVVRLADAFINGSNDLRAVIARVLGQMGSELLLVFSCNEVARRIIVVSHSNDPIARAHTLTALASIAGIAKENKEVHHIVIESLSSKHKEEFKAACAALGAYCSLSTDFTSTVMAQLSDYLLSSTSPIERKMQLVSIFTDIRADQDTTQAIFALGARLLETNTDATFQSMLLSALTSLAILTRFSIVDQLSLLLHVISTSEGSPHLTLVALTNVARLARHAHIWTKDHILKLCESRARFLTNEAVAVAFLQSLVVLARKQLPAHVGVLQEILSELSPLYTHESLLVRASFIALSVNLFTTSPADLHCRNLLSSLSSSLAAQLPKRAARKLAKVAGRFLSHDAVPEDEAINMVLTLCALPLSHPNVPIFVDLFSVLSEKRRPLIDPLAQWAIKVQKDESVSSFLPRPQLAYISLPPYSCTPDEEMVKAFERLPNWQKYQIARTGFRNGHWTTVSLPLLQSVRMLSLSPECYSWLTALTDLASSQPRSFTVSDMLRSLGHLRKAKQALQSLARSTAASRPSPFPGRYVEALEKSTMIYMQLLSSLAVFLPGQGGTPPLRECSSRVKNVLEASVLRLRQSVEEWSSLGRRTFDADDASQDSLALQTVSAQCILHGVKAMVENREPGQISVPRNQVDNVIGKETRELVCWAAASMQQLAGREELTNEMVTHFVSVFRELYTRPHCIPRFFFQPTHTTSIQLSVSPCSDGELGVVQSVPVPLRVDGVITYDRKEVPIHSLTVYVHVHFYNAPGNDVVHQRSVEPHDGCFFTAQFLLQFRESAQLDFTVEFVDTTKRRTWLSDANATLRVDVGH